MNTRAIPTMASAVLGRPLVTHAEMGRREEVGPSQEGHEMLPQESDKLSPNLKAEKRLNRPNRCF